jgi:hypothetical protein
VLVALALDDKGGPRPFLEGPTVFSYLPTGEEAGLRFLLYAHFDLPVDRERLDLDSPWNRWTLARSGLAGACGAMSLASGTRRNI